MRIIFYQNNSENIVVDKNLEEVQEYSNCNILNDNDISNISIRLNGLNDIDFNYAYIPELNRYYYINSVEHIAELVWVLHCHVDVLMSYKDAIRNQEAVINRNRDNYNLYLNDDYFKAQNDNIISLRKFSGSFPALAYVLTMVD